MALIYPPYPPAIGFALRRGGRVASSGEAGGPVISVFFGIMAGPGATYLESLIIIIITLKQNIK